MQQKEDRKADKLWNNFLELKESKRPARFKDVLFSETASIYQDNEGKSF